MAVAAAMLGGLWWHEHRQALRMRQDLELRWQQAEQRRVEADLRLQTMLRASHGFVEAADEAAIIDLVLRLSMELTGATGASFVPLDEGGRPLTAVRHGEFPLPVPDAWLEYLASPAVRQACALCQRTETVVESNCSLLKGPFSEALGLYCFPLRLAGKELGMLNLYQPHLRQLESEQQDFLRTLLDTTALALDAERLRTREMNTLTQLRAAQQKTDLTATLARMMSTLNLTLGAEFALLSLVEQGQPSLSESSTLTTGETTQQEQHLAQTLMVKAFEKELPQSASGTPALLALPLLITDHPPSGVLLLGDRNGVGFSPRQVGLAKTIANQMALVVQTTNQMADVQYQAMMDERNRLAREIHDGLAQTLGFIKLQVAQMLGYQERGDQERLRQSLRVSYDALAEAYRDVREAIDMLRISPGNEANYSLENWMRQIVAEFQENAGEQPFSITVSNLDSQTCLPPEVHAQLIRVVQEALSNIRKHAHAHQVWISCQEIDNDLVLEVRDDGQGFAAEGIPGSFRYGLRGMRERAELIGADFQVISRPGEGTIVRLRLPLDEQSRLEI